MAMSKWSQQGYRAFFPAISQSFNSMPMNPSPIFFEFFEKYPTRSICVEDRKEWGRLNYHALLEGCYPADLSFPISFYIEKWPKKKGNTYRSFLFDTWLIEPCLIADDFKILLEQHQITGWTTYPVLLYDPAGNPLLSPKYHGFTITGRCGPRIRYEADGSYKKGIYLDPALWDGSDIFFEEEYWGQYISERAFPLFKKHQKDLHLIPAALDWDDFWGPSLNSMYTKRHQKGEYKPRYSVHPMPIPEILERGLLTQEEVDEMLKKIR